MGSPTEVNTEVDPSPLDGPAEVPPPRQTTHQPHINWQAGSFPLIKRISTCYFYFFSPIVDLNIFRSRNIIQQINELIPDYMWALSTALCFIFLMKNLFY